MTPEWLALQLMTNDPKHSPQDQQARRTAANRVKAFVFLAILGIGTVLGISFGNIALGALSGLAIGGLLSTAIAQIVQRRAD